MMLQTANLVFAGGIHSVEVQPAFPDRNQLGIGGKHLPDTDKIFLPRRVGVVGMNARRAVGFMGLYEAMGCFVGHPIRAGDDARYALTERVGENFLRVAELPAKEVQPDVIILNVFYDNSLPVYSMAVQKEMTENRLHRQ